MEQRCDCCGKLTAKDENKYLMICESCETEFESLLKLKSTIAPQRANARHWKLGC
jgi:ribosomal protein L37AE/L43A